MKLAKSRIIGVLKDRHNILIDLDSIRHKPELDNKRVAFGYSIESGYVFVTFIKGATNPFAKEDSAVFEAKKMYIQRWAMLEFPSGWEPWRLYDEKGVNAIICKGDEDYDAYIKEIDSQL